MNEAPQPLEQPETISICSYCFPGLNVINDFRISHGCCDFHFFCQLFKFEMESAIDDGEIPCNHEQTG